MSPRRLLILVTLTAVLAAAAALAQPAEPDPTPAKEQASGDTPEADRARRARVIAKVGDEKITVGEVEDGINAQSPFLRARYRNPVRLQEFVRNMVRFELLAREAEKRGYDENPAAVRSLKQNAVQQLIRREFDDKITPKSIAEADVREYYDAHPEEFHRPEMVRAAHILVETEKEAKELLDKAKDADVRGFRELAREHSIDTETKLRGGDLRYFTREGRPPRSQDPPVDAALVEAAFSLEEVGDTVDAPVKVGDHWSIVKITGRREAEDRPFEEAEKSIRLKLWRERRQQAIEDFVAQLRERYKPTIYEDRMKPIRFDAAEEAPPGKAPAKAPGDTAAGEAEAKGDRSPGGAPAGEGSAPGHGHPH